MLCSTLRRLGPRAASLAPPLGSGARSYNFGTAQYDGAFAREGIPDPDTSQLRSGALAYLAAHDDSAWHTDPVATLLRGARPAADGGETALPTADAFERENGAALNASAAQVDAIIAHMNGYAPPAGRVDWRAEVRSMEAEVFGEHAGLLIGNQAMDFGKQDGVTEIEESLQANVVEQRLNDQLLAAELRGEITINRAPAYVGCVSNFSNFLDLSRKVLRNIELGVPVVVLSRSNTTQHMYRWAALLARELMPKHGVDAGLLTYAAANRAEKQRIFDEASPDCPMYFTCSREVAQDLRKLHGPVMSSTGGPNTLVATELTPAVAEAIRLSAMIENSGQCTALRHAVVPGVGSAELEAMFDGAPTSAGPVASLAAGRCDGLFDFSGNIFEHVPGYTRHGEHADIAYRVSASLPAQGDIEEQWRNVYVDVTSPDVPVSDGAFAAQLARWLVDNQPITLAINGDRALAKTLFETTGQVVYTVGTLENPALTCQARPQDGEVFGEFPVRRELAAHTKYPVVVPTPTPAYNATYTRAHLASRGANSSVSCLPPALSFCAPLLRAVGDDVARGYLVELCEYFADACATNPKVGHNQGARTALYGLQTTPRNGQLNFVRCAGGATTMADVAPFVLPFFATSAFELLRVSCDPADAALAETLAALGFVVAVEDDAAFDARVAAEQPYNVIEPALPGGEYPLMGQFVSLLLCLGHIKSTTPNDDAFVADFSTSPKWLQLRKA